MVTPRARYKRWRCAVQTIYNLPGAFQPALVRPRSSAVEHFFGKEEVTGSILVEGSSFCRSNWSNQALRLCRQNHLHRIAGRQESKMRITVHEGCTSDKAAVAA